MGSTQKLSNCNGYKVWNNGTTVYEHRKVAEEKLGRKLRREEVVHHIDENRSNNHPDNLMVFNTGSDHSRHHQNPEASLIQLTNGAFICEQIIEWKICQGCQIKFEPAYSKQMFCSKKCVKKSYKIEWPSKSELEKLVWSKPTSVLAADLGVSDVAIAKRCKALGIQKPPRGYWAKQK